SNASIRRANAPDALDTGPDNRRNRARPIAHRSTAAERTRALLVQRRQGFLPRALARATTRLRCPNVARHVRGSGRTQPFSRPARALAVTTSERARARAHDSASELG